MLLTDSSLSPYYTFKNNDLSFTKIIQFPSLYNPFSFLSGKKTKSQIDKERKEICLRESAGNNADRLSNLMPFLVKQRIASYKIKGDRLTTVKRGAPALSLVHALDVCMTLPRATISVFFSLTRDFSSFSFPVRRFENIMCSREFNCLHKYRGASMAEQR